MDVYSGNSNEKKALADFHVEGPSTMGSSISWQFLYKLVRGVYAACMNNAQAG